MGWLSQRDREGGLLVKALNGTQVLINWVPSA
jgi:hypothetical protein